MDASTLRAAQAPLKDRYRTEPTTARTATAAAGDYRDPDVTATIDGFAGPVRAGLHPASGGDGSDACSADLLLQAVLACAGVTLRAVATARGVEVRSATLRADAPLFDDVESLRWTGATPAFVALAARFKAAATATDTRRRLHR